MYDDNFEKIIYNYFNVAPIIETENGTYADKNAPLNKEYAGLESPHQRSVEQFDPKRVAAKLL